MASCRVGSLRCEGGECGVAWGSGSSVRGVTASRLGGLFGPAPFSDVIIELMNAEDFSSPLQVAV